MYKLVIQDDEGKTTVVPLIRDELTIGRKEGNTIRLTERNVSRRHARLIRQNGSITIEDLNSYNGIRVNGSRISGRCQIREADRVQIGDYLIEVKSEAQDKVDTLNERTVPLERIDPHAHTPVPESPPTQPIDTAAIATTRMTKDPSSPVVQFTSSPTEPMQAVQPPDEGMSVSQPLAPVTPVPPAPAMVPQGHARLVVLSSNFAGREFDLDKPSMVIGRTEDNDICVNHRSISRHHAKIVRENGRYAIVDLQSSNGVRVNGEEYGKVELRRADVVDLGHVRLRFVEPGEDFLFGRDAQAVDVVPQGGSRLALWITVGLVVTGAIVALFLMLTKDEKPAEEAGTTPAPVTPQNGKAAAAPALADAAPPQVAPVPVNDELGKELAAARDAIGREKWVEAQAAARRALMKDASSQEASDLFEQAKSELAAEKIYKAFTRAVAAKNFDEVARQYRTLHPDSVYRVKAQPDHDRMKGDFVRARGEKGRQLAAKGQCGKQRTLARESGKTWPEAEEAVMATPCKEAASGGGTPSGGGGGTPSGGGGTPSGGGGTPSGGGGGTPSGGGGAPSGGGGGTPSGASFDQLHDEARDAYRADQFGRALNRCEMALALRPGDQGATLTCAFAACRMKQVAKAKKFMRALSSETRQDMVRQTCMKAGVTDL